MIAVPLVNIHPAVIQLDSVSVKPLIRREIAIQDCLSQYVNIQQSRIRSNQKPHIQILPSKFQDPSGDLPIVQTFGGNH